MPPIPLIRDLDAAALARFDAIIDVRSPAEFAEDHVPGAVNLPVLTDAERAEVGTIYTQESPFKARRIGAAHVARNIAIHLEGALKDRPAGFKPLIYCWRGGMRSRAMATILSQVGWRTTMIDGGYRTYRREVQARLYGPPLPLDLVLLDGNTGCAKTEILGRLAERGVQVLDLEGMAEHRGSLLGGFAGRAQPSQKLFETRIAAAVAALDPDRPVVAEAESSKIGDRMIPPALWGLMTVAPRIELAAPMAARARYLARAYRDVVEDESALEAALARLPTHPGRERIATWRGLAGAGEYEALATALMELHYDPAYARSSRKDERPRLGAVAMTGLGAADQEGAADAVTALLTNRDQPAG